MSDLAAICAGLAVMVWMAPRASAARRLRMVTPVVASIRALHPLAPARGKLSGAGSAIRLGSRLPAMAAVATGTLVAAGIGGLVGAFGGICAGVLVFRALRRSATGAANERRRQMSHTLPLATDLLAACIASGASPRLALTAVAEAIGGPLDDELRRVVAVLDLGGDPVGSWLTLGMDNLLGPLSAAFR